MSKRKYEFISESDLKTRIVTDVKVVRSIERLEKKMRHISRITKIPFIDIRANFESYIYDYYNLGYDFDYLKETAKTNYPDIRDILDISIMSLARFSIPFVWRQYASELTQKKINTTEDDQNDN